MFPVSMKYSLARELAYDILGRTLILSVNQNELSISPIKVREIIHQMHF